MPKTKAPNISEATIQKTCSDFLALDGWRRIRTDMKQLRGMGVQEPGMADDLYIRYIPALMCSRCPTVSGGCSNCRSAASVLWVEWKRMTSWDAPTKATKLQVAWHEAERARGALTLIAGIDFPASIEGFMEWYKGSGLSRNLR